MKIPQKLLNLQDVRKSDALIHSPIRSLTPRVQLCPEPATIIQQFIIMSIKLRGTFAPNTGDLK